MARQDLFMEEVSHKPMLKPDQKNYGFRRKEINLRQEWEGDERKMDLSWPNYVDATVDSSLAPFDPKLESLRDQIPRRKR
jgi:hypothetical protein